MKRERWDVKGFEPGHLEEHIGEMKRSLLGRGGDKLQMSFFPVDWAYRNRGVGRALVEFAVEEARARGARRLYISASPSKATVDFYLGCGARLAEKVDKRLYALEPEDIHLELVLD